MEKFAIDSELAVMIEEYNQDAEAMRARMNEAAENLRSSARHDAVSYGEKILSGKMTLNDFQELKKRRADQLEEYHSAVFGPAFAEAFRQTHYPGEALGERDAL